MRLRLLLGLALSAANLFGAGCATTSNTAGSGEAAAYFPLAVGHRWSYRIVPGPPEPQQVEIIEQDAQGFFVDSRGGRLAPRTDGVFDGRRFLLQEPLVLEKTWTAQLKNEPVERFKITATDAVVVVAAGTFSPCVVVRGEQPTPPGAPPGKLIATWTYARNVGLIRFEQQVHLGTDAPQTTTTMELVSFEVKPAP